MSETPSDQPTLAELRAFAYRLLGRREYSVFELVQRVRRKWPQLELAAAEELAEALIAENLLSDRRFAESYVRMAVSKQQGPLKIRAALRDRGVADSLITEALDGYADRWIGLAIEWLQRQHAGPLDYGGRGKYYRRLLNRGFSHDHAMDALNHMQ